MTPEKGKWSIPAGFLDHGEDPASTAVREVFEETNLQVVISELVDVYYNAEALRRGGASIFILYRARLVGGLGDSGKSDGEEEEEAGDDLQHGPTLSLRE